MAMGLRVWMEKLLMVLHLRSLDEDTLANRIYREQKENNWPGLAKEAKMICSKLKIEDVNETSMSKSDYKKVALEACKAADEEKLRMMAENSEKCKRIMQDSYGKKDYVKNKNIQTCREFFRTRVSMHNFAGNYTNNNKYKGTGWLCRCGLSKEQVIHLMSGTCKHTDLTRDEELVNMFMEILARRDALDEEGAVVAGDATDVRGFFTRTSQSGHPFCVADCNIFVIYIMKTILAYYSSFPLLYHVRPF